MTYRLDRSDADGYDAETQVVLYAEHEEVIDDIERQVNKALDEINSIKGINCVDKCREILRALSANLC